MQTASPFKRIQRTLFPALRQHNAESRLRSPAPVRLSLSLSLSLSFPLSLSSPSLLFRPSHLYVACVCSSLVRAACSELFFYTVAHRLQKGTSNTTSWREQAKDTKRRNNKAATRKRMKQTKRTKPGPQPSTPQQFFQHVRPTSPHDRCFHPNYHVAPYCTECGPADRLRTGPRRRV
jgi:hypothetical protein